MFFTPDGLTSAQHHPHCVTSRDQLLFTPQSASCTAAVASWSLLLSAGLNTTTPTLRCRGCISVVWKPRPAGARVPSCFAIRLCAPRSLPMLCNQLRFRYGMWGGWLFAGKANQNYEVQIHKITKKYKLQQCQMSLFRMLSFLRWSGPIQDFLLNVSDIHGAFTYSNRVGVTNPTASGFDCKCDLWLQQVGEQTYLRAILPSLTSRAGVEA